MLSAAQRAELVELVAYFERIAALARESGREGSVLYMRDKAQLLRDVIANLWPPVVAGTETAGPTLPSAAPTPAANSRHAMTPPQGLIAELEDLAKHCDESVRIFRSHAPDGNSAAADQQVVWASTVRKAAQALSDAETWEQELRAGP